MMPLLNLHLSIIIVSADLEMKDFILIPTYIAEHDVNHEHHLLYLLPLPMTPLHKTNVKIN